MTRRDCAAARIRALQALVKTQKWIAAEVELLTQARCHFTTINKILNDRNRSVSKKLAAALGTLVRIAYKELFEKLIHRFQMTVVERGSNETVDSSEILHSVITTLNNLFDPVPAPVDLPPGIPAALVSLGPDVYLLKLSPHTSDNQKRLLVIHELEHVLQRLRADLQDPEEPYRPRPGL